MPYSAKKAQGNALLLVSDHYIEYSYHGVIFGDSKFDGNLAKFYSSVVSCD